MVAAAMDLTQDLSYAPARGPCSVFIAKASQLLPIDSALFHPLAVCNQGDTSFQFNKKTTGVDTGSVATRKWTHVDAWEGSMGYKSLDLQPLVNELAVGTTAGVVSYTAATAAWSDTVHSSNTSNQVIPVTTGTMTNLAINDRVTIESGPTGFKKKYLGVVTNIDSTSTPKTITLQKPLKFVPASGDAIQKVKDYGWKVGGDAMDEYSMLYNYSLNNDERLLIHAAGVQFTGNFTKENTPEGIKTGLEATVLGKAETIGGFTNQQTVLVTCKAILPASA